MASKKARLTCVFNISKTLLAEMSKKIKRCQSNFSIS